MTRDQRVKNMSLDELSRFLYDFSCKFYSETLDDLCDIDCKDSKNSCYGCIKEWLSSEKEINFE